MPWGEIFSVFEASSVDFTNATKQAVRPDTWPWNEFIQPVTVICHLGACRRSQQYKDLAPILQGLHVCRER